MDLVGRLLRLGVFYGAQHFAAIAQRDAVRWRKRCLRSHYRDLNLGAILSYEVLASVPLGRDRDIAPTWHSFDVSEAHYCLEQHFPKCVLQFLIQENAQSKKRSMVS